MSECGVTWRNRQSWWISLLTALSACGGVADVSGPHTDAASIEVPTATSGPHPGSDGYTVSLNDSGVEQVGVIDTLVIAAVPRGTHTITLAGVADNCMVDQGNARSVEVKAATSSRVGFDVVCALPATGIRVTVTTTGLGPGPRRLLAST
jgi:hypothetical protein